MNLRTFWRYGRVTLVSLLVFALLCLGYTLFRGGRTACDFSDTFFWGSVLVILAGGVVAGVGGRGQPAQARSAGGRRPLRERGRLTEAERRERYRMREEAIGVGIAVAAAALPMLLLAWRLCPG